MKKTKIAVTCAVLATASLSAHADPSVTLSGVVDDAVAYVHNSDGHRSQWNMASGILSTDEWTLSGSEDLGGGMTADFTLQNNFDINSGELSNEHRLFGSQATVGLSSKAWGTLTLGRQNDPVTELVQPVTAQTYSGTFAPPGDVDNYDNSVEFDNAIQWASPSWGGFTLQAMYAFGGVAGSTGSGQTWSGGASYANGPLSAAAGFLHVDNGNAATSARGTTSADSFFNSAVNQAYASAHSVDITRAGVQYLLGKVTLGGAYSFSQYKPDAASSFSRSEKYHNGSVYAQWPVTSVFLTIVGYNYTRSTGDSSAKYHQLNLGVDYLLSKRTDLYATTAWQHASGTNGIGAAQAVIGSYDVNSGARSQMLAFLGMRQKF
ncbi:porin [Paraburkholderia phosphatilytica]|uniref:porin n=1 Tax=Paraburkholderia phosphatilytica TaxID=2282883 RepID=UPI000E4D0532|nr:porin [Paraburkholderia phosphatilytica]